MVLSPPMGPLERSPMTVYMAQPSDDPPPMQRQISRQSSYAKLSNSASGKVRKYLNPFLFRLYLFLKIISKNFFETSQALVPLLLFRGRIHLFHQKVVSNRTNLTIASNLWLQMTILDRIVAPCPER